MDALGSILYTTCKYLLFAILSFVIYVVYISLVRPIMFRQKYKKYSNVYVSKKFNYLMGDLKEYRKAAYDGKVYYNSYKEENTRYDGFDVEAKLAGTGLVIKLHSNRAIREFVSLQPAKIDKGKFRKGFGKIGPYGFGFNPSTKSVLERRKGVTKLLGLNSSSKYIGDMLKVTKSIFEEM
jgi:hypothetical protein